MRLDKEIIELTLKLRFLSSMNLPIKDSLIAYDLIFYIALSHSCKKKITINQLFIDLPYSYTAVRQHYRRLLNDGYINHRKDEKDGRIKYVVPTNKLIECISQYTIQASFYLDSPIKLIEGNID